MSFQHREKGLREERFAWVNATYVVKVGFKDSGSLLWQGCCLPPNVSPLFAPS